jgi:2'-5' RNA ligase
MFAAVLPPEEVLEDLDAFLAPRREAAAFRWTIPESWHLTLAFMADVPDRHLDELVERYERAGRRRTPFRLRIAGGGAFPNVGRAKVLYAALAGEPAALEELRRLATGARAAANKAGAAVDGTAFRGHVTLARMNRPVEATRWVRLLDGYAGPEFEVSEFVLIASHLGEGPRNRPRHVTVGSFPLGRVEAASEVPHGEMRR